jgi:hypothetical protein
MTKFERRAIAGLVVVVAVGLSSLLEPHAVGAESVRDASRQTARVSIHWKVADKTNQVAVQVSGLSGAALRELSVSSFSPEQWGQLFSVYASQGDLISDVRIPPMIGRYFVASNLLCFEPQFPLQEGVRYRAVFRPGKLPGVNLATEPITSIYDLPKRAADASTVVTEVYPTADVLPENLLKFYLHFSGPMSRGHIYDHIQLRDQNSKSVELPFLEIDEELWDPSLTRLTLFIDPGRIKRGVRPLEEIGPALQAGKHYSLVIDRAWKDANGNALAKSFEKTFSVGPPDREPLDTRQWRIREPKPNSDDSLEITFPKPLDHALAQRTIHVLGPLAAAGADSNESVAGRVTLADHERRWRFTPSRPWTDGRYRLEIETTLEDLAGNNIGKPFEVDLFDGVQRRITNSVVQLSFQIR